MSMEMLFAHAGPPNSCIQITALHQTRPPVPISPLIAATPNRYSLSFLHARHFIESVGQTVA